MTTNNMTTIELQELEDLRARLEQPTAPIDIYALGARRRLTADEFLLGTCGYRQNFNRSFSLVDLLAATFITMSFLSTIPSMFVFALLNGGPRPTLVNWVVGGIAAFITAVSIAEIAAVYPTAGGIYFWSYKLGGPKYGPFLSWMTAWFSWLGWITIVPAISQAGTNLLLSAFQLAIPHATILDNTKSPWLPWLTTSLAIAIFAFIPNTRSQFAMKWMIRLTLVTSVFLYIIFTFVLPIHVALHKHLHFQKTSFLRKFHKDVDIQGVLQPSASYCWVVGFLFPAWEFYGYDTAVHMAEETTKASKTVAWSMLSGVFIALILSIPTLVALIFCIQDLDAILHGGFVNNFAEYLRQIVGDGFACFVLIICWINTMQATSVCFMSAQRVTFAIARDRILPGSKWISRLTPNKMPRNAGIVVLFLAFFIEASILVSLVSFEALTATATISTNLSYLFPIFCRLRGKHWKHARKWHLGVLSRPINFIATAYISFLFIVLMLPTQFPIKAKIFNYAPIMIIVITITALATWFWPKNGAVHWYHGPRRYISKEEVDRAIVVPDGETGHRYSSFGLLLMLRPATVPTARAAPVAGPSTLSAARTRAATVAGPSILPTINEDPIAGPSTLPTTRTRAGTVAGIPRQTR